MAASRKFTPYPTAPLQRLAPLAPLATRLCVGSVLIGHGFHFTPTEFAGLLGGSNSPVPLVIGWLVDLLLFGGGALLVVGLLTRLVTVPALVHLTLAVVIVEGGEGFAPKSGGGVQIPLLLIGGLLVLLLSGPGPVSLDALLRWDNGWSRQDAARSQEPLAAA